MSRDNGLDELAALAKTLTPERRRELDGRLPFDGSLRVNLGIVRGLAATAQAMEAEIAEAAKELRELAAVGAARAQHEQQEFARISQEIETPEARAQLEAEAELVRTGKMPLVDVREVIDLMKERERQWREEGSKGG